MSTLRNLGLRLTCTLLLAWYGLVAAPPRRRQAGQSLIEFALIVAVIAVVAIPAMQVLRNGFATAYLVHQEALALPSVAPTPTVRP